MSRDGSSVRAWPPRGDQGCERSLGPVLGPDVFSRFWFYLTVLCWRKRKAGALQTQKWGAGEDAGRGGCLCADPSAAESRLPSGPLIIGLTDAHQDRAQRLKDPPSHPRRGPSST